MAAVEERLAAVERILAALSGEVSTRRLVVVDEAGRPRLVAEVRGTTVELRLLVGAPDGAGSVAQVVLHATEGDDSLGPLAGVQLWAHGDAVAELDEWPEEAGRWWAHLHLSVPG